MCGFVGFTGLYENKIEYIRKMSDRIIHRGPDMYGEYISPNGNVAMAFRRLSILDLSEAGSQPMSSPDDNYKIVFNGEIYNFLSLRSQLELCGYKFYSQCDTEVILAAYDKYGFDMVSHLRGMFSFVIHDIKKNILFGARDFFGIKPFYYGKLKNGGLIFGSEIKSFLECPLFEKKINQSVIRSFLTFQYSATEETFFSGVNKLPAAHYFIYSLSENTITLKKYWDVNFQASYEESFEKRVHRLDEVIRESVTAHRIADVKVGAFLSGGVDSSYITAAMMPDKTFSVGFDFEQYGIDAAEAAKFNENVYAEKLSKILGINNYCKIIGGDECMDILPVIQYHMDEPQANPSSIPLYFLAKLASEHVTVVLSGEGSDEIYAGYEWYGENFKSNIYKKLPSFIRNPAASFAEKNKYFRGREFLIRNSGKPENYFIGQALVYPKDEAVSILKEPYKNGYSVDSITDKIYSRVTKWDELTKKQYLDINLWLPGDILLKADKMSMAHSLELRVPFLDRYVMEDAATLPSEYKIDTKQTKKILRCASGLTIPDEWANRPKKGFPVPIRHWFTTKKWYDYIMEYFLSDFAKEFFDCGQLAFLAADHYNKIKNNARKIYTALTFLIWYKRFFIDE